MGVPPHVPLNPSLYDQVGTAKVAGASEMLYSFDVMQQLDLDGQLQMTQDVALLVGRGCCRDGGAGGQGPWSCSASG